MSEHAQTLLFRIAIVLLLAAITVGIWTVADRTERQTSQAHFDSMTPCVSGETVVDPDTGASFYAPSIHC